MESKSFNLAMNVIKYVVGVLGVILCIWMLVSSTGYNLEEIPQREEFAKTSEMSAVTFYTMIVIVAAVAGVLIFFLFQLISNTKKTAMSIAGIIAAFVLYFIIRLMGTSDTNASLGHAGGKYEVSDATLAATNAGIWTVIIGVVAAFLLAVLGPFIFGKYRK